VIAVEEVRATLPEAAKDIRLNLQSVLEGGALSDAQKWGVAAACAIAARDPRLRDAVLADALVKAGPDVVEDARAAAVLMAMNNVYYRFRTVGFPYSHSRPACAQRIATAHEQGLQLASRSRDQRLRGCVRSHEQVVVEGDSARSMSTMRSAPRRSCTRRR
jgi:alkyl hydroperoxide reductase subunit D